MDKFKVKSAIGYLWLSKFLEKQGIKTYPYFRESYLLEKGNHRIIETPDITRYYYKQKNINDNIWANIEFALKHEGLNLQLMEKLLNLLTKEEVKNYVIRNSKGKYNRIIWFLYEWLTENELDLKDVDTKLYIELLDSRVYYTCKPINYKRYAIKENLLGNKRICPFVRKKNTLSHYDKLDLKEKIQNTLNQFDSNLIKRASAYLYYRETKSSYEIERDKPNQARVARFVNVLERVDQLEKLSKDLFISLQNKVVDPRYAQKDYRTWQNYVGESLIEFERIHYIAPKGEDVEALMSGLIDCYERMKDSNLPPLLIAAIISFGFVFIHPFEDGNGRIHRFLIHYILSKQYVTPPGIIFPVSSTILNDLRKYDEILESFSKPLLQLIDYELDDDRKMTVACDTEHYYKFIDMTQFVEYLYTCIIDTIDISLVKELEFLIKFDTAKKEMQEIVDMPDQQINLFIKLCKQNNGKLSNTKRTTIFDKLTDKEIEKLEEIYKKYLL